MTSKFCRYELRTTEADVASEFYAQLLGPGRAVVWSLHEQARARGAMPHWLGSIAVEDLIQLEKTSEEMVKRGATKLGPTFPTSDGGHAAVLRDPGGAIVGLATRHPTDPLPTVNVAWQVLNTENINVAIENYHVLFGWKIAEEPLMGPHGAFHEFCWDDSQQARAGALADIAGRPGVHPHWLFFFRVDSIENAIALTRGAGGTATDPIVSDSGERISICEDPQGAAFGIIEQLA